MKARYIGYPGDAGEESPLYVTHLGVTFRRDRWATLPEKIDPVQFKKLQDHPHFEVAEGEGEELPPDEAAEVQANTPGAAPKVGKADLIARLSALANTHPDVEFDPKWSAAKLQAKLEEAEFEHGDD
jgi:hypothetical protein